MGNEYTKSARNVLVLAQEQAKFFKHQAVGTEHLLLALAMEYEGMAGKVLARFGLDADKIRREIENYTGYGNLNPLEREDYLPYSPKAAATLRSAGEEARNLQAKNIGTEHILLALLGTQSNLATRMLGDLNVKPADIQRQVLKNIGVNTDSIRGKGGHSTAKGTPTLDGLGRDLTKIAAGKQMDPVIGRAQEVKRVIQILSRRTKNNPVLVGEPGVGKTAIAEGLAQKIISKEVPANLQGKRLVLLDMAAVVAGTKYRGEFEERLRKIVDEVYNDGNVILFIDELHTLIGAGGAEGAIDASNLLKPALARGEVQIVGATTLNEYQKYIETDTALERRFAKVIVNEPSEADTTEILVGLKSQYEKHHRVNITNEAIEAAVKLSVRYIPDRFLPDKAIDVIDEAAAKVRINNPEVSDEFSPLTQKLAELVQQCDEALLQQDFEKAAKLRREFVEVNEELEAKRRQQATQKLLKKDDAYSLFVTTEDVAEIVAEWTGVPVTQMQKSEQTRLINLEKVLHERVIGQNEAVSAISRAIRRARSGLKDPKKPIGSFMFLGPTGVGKTELAKALAEAIFGSEKNMIRIDMSEYMEKYSSSRLVGAAPGYVGFDEGGQLTEKVHQQPYSVVLLDEVEKAHPDIFNLLLQVLDDGYLTDSKGRRVDFSNTIIIMTSNLGATRIRDEKTMGFGAKKAEADYEAMAAKVRESLKEQFRPEFINRIDETIIFHSLDKPELHEIVKLMAQSLLNRVKEQGIDIKITPAAIDVVAAAGFDPEYGARPLRRALQTKVEDLLSEELLSGHITVNSHVTIGAAKGEIKLTIKDPETSR